MAHYLNRKNIFCIVTAQKKISFYYFFQARKNFGLKGFGDKIHVSGFCI